MPYLLQVGLLQPESIVESDVVVLDASGRNWNHKVVREHGDCYLLKQGNGKDGEAAIAHEAAMYRFLGSIRAAPELAPFLPRFIRYDFEQRLLVLELIRNAENLSEHYLRRGRVHARVAAAMGRALGTLHRVTHQSCGELTALAGSEDHPAWALSIHDPDVGLLREASSANVQLVRIIQEFPEFCSHLDRLRESWKTECVIHGDLKSANCILSRAPVPRRAPALKIVDWELARIGDPGWDVGSVFGDYLGLWLLSAPITEETDPERFLKLTRFPLERMHPAIRSFWESYVEHGEIDPSVEPALLSRSVLYAAARLVQTTYETMQFSVRLSGNAICLLQLSWNMMRRPHEAAFRLLGLPLSSAILE